MMLLNIIIVVIILYYYIIIHIAKNNNTSYECNILLRQPILNTIFSNMYFYYFDSKYLNYFTKNVECEAIKHDSEKFLLEWLPCKKIIQNNNRPIIVFAHTIDSNIKRNQVIYYIMYYLHKKIGANIVRIDFRGYNFKLQKCFSLYETGLTDLYYIINYISTIYNTKKIYLFGISLSGTLFINMLNRYKLQNIAGVILLSSPPNILDMLTQSKMKMFNYPEKLLIKLIKSYFDKNVNANLHPNLTNDNKTKLANLKSFNDFFINYINPINNNKFKSILHWSNAYNIIPILKNIKLPVLILHSHDDFVYAYTKNTIESLSKNKYISYVLTKYGGHNGFLTNDKKIYYLKYVFTFISNIENNI